MRNSFLQVFLTGLLSTAIFSQSMPAGAALMGFSGDNSLKEKALEARFDSALKAENLRNWLKHLSARPHHVGSPYDKENAEYIASLMKAAGFETQIESFDV